VKFIPIARCTSYQRLKALDIYGFNQAALDFLSELPQLQAVSLHLSCSRPQPALLFKQTCLSSITKFFMELGSLKRDLQWMQFLHCLPSLRELSLRVPCQDTKEDITVSALGMGKNGLLINTVPIA
jgi:hypothetical protein